MIEAEVRDSHEASRREHAREKREKITLEAKFEAEAGATALVGRSGSGKSWLLDVIAGLRRAKEGRVVLRGKTMSDAERRVWTAPERRGLGYAFQESLIFPHYTTRRNLGYGGGAEASVEEMGERLGLSEVMDRRGGVLSGGEKKRTALGRAMLRARVAAGGGWEGAIILLDEPFTGLDSVRREAARSLVEEAARGGATAVVVTHDIREAARLADKAAVMEGGKLIKSGDALETLNDWGGSGDEAISVMGGVLEEIRGELGGFRVGGGELGGMMWAPREGAVEGERRSLCVSARDAALARGDMDEAALAGLSMRTALRGKVRRIRGAKTETNEGAEQNKAREGQNKAREGMWREVEVEVGGSARVWARVTADAYEALGLAPKASVYVLVKTASAAEAL